MVWKGLVDSSARAYQAQKQKPRQISDTRLEVHAIALMNQAATKTGVSPQISSRVPHSLYDALKTEAEKRNLSLGNMALIAISGYFGIETQPLKRGRPNKK